MSTTKPGSLLKASIPIWTFAGWTEDQPGFLEMDLVAHCGESTEGFYLNTLSAVDIATGWVECQAVWGKGQDRVGGAVHHIAQSLPFPQRGLGYDYVLVAIDDHSRYAYAEALSDERGGTTASFLEQALAHFVQRGICSQRILTDNGGGYISRAFRQVADSQGIRLKRTRPYRPQTNGKAEAFIKIFQAEWAYVRPYTSNQQRLALLPAFLAYYNCQRPHGGIGGATPASRL